MILKVLETGQVMDFAPEAAVNLLNSGRARRVEEKDAALEEKDVTTGGFDFKSAVVGALQRIETACLRFVGERRG